MKVYNNTKYSNDEILSFPVIGYTASKWRQRNICLREHPEDPTRLISDGITFDESMRVIADESKEEWAIALEYIEQGKVYTSE